MTESIEERIRIGQIGTTIACLDWYADRAQSPSLFHF